MYLTKMHYLKNMLSCHISIFDNYHFQQAFWKKPKRPAYQSLAMKFQRDTSQGLSKGKAIAGSRASPGETLERQPQIGFIHRLHKRHWLPVGGLRTVRPAQRIPQSADSTSHTCIIVYIMQVSDVKSEEKQLFTMCLYEKQKYTLIFTVIHT